MALSDLPTWVTVLVYIVTLRGGLQLEAVLIAREYDRLTKMIYPEDSDLRVLIRRVITLRDKLNPRGIIHGRLGMMLNNLHHILTRR